MLDGLFLSVLNMSMAASLVILVVLLVRLLLKKAPKIFSYALWAVVLFRLICPFSFESAIGLLPINKTPIPHDIAYQAQPQVDTGINIVDNMVNPMLPIPNNAENSVNPLQIWVFVGSAIWAIGMLAMLLYSIIQFVRLKKKLIGATPLQDNIYLADHISSPFVMGFIKPNIYLPSSMAKTEQVFIIAHENYHIRRFDHIARILGFIALTIHWFNPLAWLAFVLSGKDMEMSCDEAVMRKMDTDIRAEYSKSLLRFATGRKFITATPLAFGEGDTKDRVKNVMRYKKPMLWVSIIAVIAVVCVVVGLMSNTKNNPIPVPNSNEVTSIRIEQINEGGTLGVIETTDKNQIETILKALQNTDKIMRESINDSPNRDNYFQIDINALYLQSIYLYNDRKQYYIEQPYGGIYKTSREVSSSIASIYTANLDLVSLSAIEERNITLADFEAIKIGTEKNEILRQFGQPNETLSGMNGDVYIVEGKQIIIYYGLEKEGSYPVTEVKISDYIPKKLTHDQAVVSALNSIGSRYLRGECFAEGHIILGYDDSDKNETKIYALTSIGSYGFENNNFAQVSGSAFPAVITLNSDNSVSIEQPLDGSDNTVSIKKMFPKEYHDRIFGYEDSDRENLKQQEEKYAKEYLSKIGRDAKIGDYSDFEHLFLTDVGVSVQVSNNLENFYKQHSYYPSFIGTRERLENGVRVVYEMSYETKQDEIKFIKYNYDTKEIIEQFIASANTGEIID